MRKLLLSLVAIACYATAIWAVPAPVAFLSHHCDNPQGIIYVFITNIINNKIYLL